MSVAFSSPTEQRHPWLVALVIAPETELNALVGGFAEIAPYGRAEPADAAVSLLFGLPEEDPARRAFDDGCLALLERFRRGLLDAPEARYAPRLAAFDRLLAVIRRTRPARTVADLHRRYPYWMNLLEGTRLDAGLDPRREYLRLLALTQDMPGRDRRLMPLWLGICAEAGPLGRYAPDYLDVGLLGLRRLSLATGQDGNEEAVCHGLARWAAQQQPPQAGFLARWREIESAYPRGAAYWPPLVERVLATVETHLSEENKGQAVSFPVAGWWREDMELPAVAPGRRAPPPARKGPVEPANMRSWKAITDNIEAPIQTLESQVGQVIATNSRYTDATGDPYYLIRSACNLGMRLLKTRPEEAQARGKIAVKLARLALEHEPANVFAWALWRDGMAAQGARGAAEAIGWEAIRRFPENPQWRTQLATLLADGRGRPQEAALLLRETARLFPLNEAVRPQLARLLSERLGAPGEAREVLEEALRILPDNPFSYGDLAALLADHFRDRAGAEAVLRENLQRFPDDQVGRGMLARLGEGRPLRRAPGPRPADAPEEDLVEDEVTLPAAGLRRALFRLESGEMAGLEQLLQQDPSLAYARYVATRAGLATPGGRLETGFAFAFQRAVKAGSAEAFAKLTREHPRGVENLVATAGLTLVSGGQAFPMPPGFDARIAGPPMRRFQLLAGGLSEALGQGRAEPSNLLRLVSDMAASELSLAAA